MKLIKYMLFTILLLGVSYVSAQTQYCTPTYMVDGKPYRICAYYNISATVNTPVGKPVSVLQWYSDDWTSSQKNDLKNGYMKMYSGLTFESEATAKYNCHAYAWAGGTTYWMNPPNQAQYWNDYSYVEITTPPPVGAKVRYTADDHSAVTTSTAGEFSSKWGAGPRFKHPIANSPYTATTGSLEYYVRPAITCSSSILCPSPAGASVSVINAPPGFTWGKSDNINLSSTTGTPIIASAGGGSGAGWMSVKVGSAEVVRYNLSVAGTVVSGEFVAGTGSWQPLYTVNHVPSSAGSVTATLDYPGTNTYSWSLVSSSGSVPWTNSGDILSFDMSSATAVTFRVTVNRISPCTGSVTSDFNFIK